MPDSSQVLRMCQAQQACSQRPLHILLLYVSSRTKVTYADDDWVVKYKWSRRCCNNEADTAPQITSKRHEDVYATRNGNLVALPFFLSFFQPMQLSHQKPVISLDSSTTRILQASANRLRDHEPISLYVGSEFTINRQKGQQSDRP